MKNAKELFKEICREEFYELKSSIKQLAEEHNCSIKLKPKHVLIEVEDPFNMNGTDSYQLKYRSGILDEIYALFDEIDDILRTLYQPCFLGMKPVIMLALGNIISELECDEYEVYLFYKGNEEPEVFAYNSAGYERFVNRISDLIESTHRVLTIPDHKPCSNHAEHCQNCGNTQCEHHIGLIKSLWSNLSAEERQHIKEILEPDKLAELEKAIG